MAARAAHYVRALEFAAVRAFLECSDAERIVAAAHAALGGRSLSLRDGHFGTLLWIFKRVDTPATALRQPMGTTSRAEHQAAGRIAKARPIADLARVASVQHAWQVIGCTGRYEEVMR